MRFTREDFLEISSIELGELQYCDLAASIATICNRKLAAQPATAKVESLKQKEVLEEIARHDRVQGYPTGGEWVQLLAKVREVLK